VVVLTNVPPLSVGATEPQSRLGINSSLCGKVRL
jgi:hypothetical protein